MNPFHYPQLWDDQPTSLPHSSISLEFKFTIFSALLKKKINKTTTYCFNISLPNNFIDILLWYYWSILVEINVDFTKWYYISISRNKVHTIYQNSYIKKPFPPLVKRLILCKKINFILYAFIPKNRNKGSLSASLHNCITF